MQEAQLEVAFPEHPSNTATQNNSLTYDLHDIGSASYNAMQAAGLVNHANRLSGSVPIHRPSCLAMSPMLSNWEVETMVGGDMRSWANEFVGGWNLTTIISVRSGFPPGLTQTSDQRFSGGAGTMSLG